MPFFAVGRGWKRCLNKIDSKWYLVELESALGPVEKWVFLLFGEKSEVFCFRKWSFPTTLLMFFEG